MGYKPKGGKYWEKWFREHPDTLPALYRQFKSSIKTAEALSEIAGTRCTFSTVLRHLHKINSPMVHKGGRNYKGDL